MFIRFGSYTVPNTQLHNTGQQSETDQRPLTIRPETNILETTKGIELFIEMPGVEKDRIGLTIENNVLTVNGSRKGEHQTEQMKYLLQESCGYDYRRSWKLNTDLDTEKVAAQYEQGVLHVVVPKKEEMRLRTISVK